jgi:hypothetical protein
MVSCSHTATVAGRLVIGRSFLRRRPRSRTGSRTRSRRRRRSLRRYRRSGRHSRRSLHGIAARCRIGNGVPGLRDGAGGVAGASPDRDGAMVAGFGDWALANSGSIAVALEKRQLQRESWLCSSGGPGAERLHWRIRSAARRRAAMELPQRVARFVIREMARCHW